ncbi:discoidin domain-containing protein [Streptomyces morookaense]|uniref:discoidin domain-containing protein n=1 Tax=Streptomyces morookaense TaxID=1970 RepID=UPI00340B4D93
MALEKDDAIASLVGDTNLAAGRPMRASSSSDWHGPDQIGVHEDTAWWESKYKAPFPHWIQVDLGSRRTVRRLVLRTPEHWPAQSQTLTVEGSDDGSTFTTLVPSARYDFTPGTTIDLPGGGAVTRVVRLFFTANNGPGPWGERGAFLWEFEVYGQAGEEPGQEGPPLPEPAPTKQPFGPGQKYVTITTYRTVAGTVHVGFKGDLKWDGEGGYTISGKLDASAARGAGRATVWLEYGGKSESWKKSGETEAANGASNYRMISLSGKLARGEKLELRLGAWQGVVLGIGGTEYTEKQRYEIS